MRIDDPAFLGYALPALLAVFFLVVGAHAFYKKPSASTTGASLVLAIGSLLLISRGSEGAWLLGAAVSTMGIASVVERVRGRVPLARAAVAVAVVGNLAAFVVARQHLSGRAFAFSGAAVVACHAVAFVVDVYRGEATVRRPLTALLYLVQFPVLAAGPIVRYQDFSRQHGRIVQSAGLASFTYGMRRVLIGIVKVSVVARLLAEPVDAIFSLPAARLSVDAAWLAAVSFSLQLYYQFSGYSDLAIGLGRMFGLRYPDNFRRPYLADSVREFWRRWNVTAITWLRDYLSLPMAGRDRPTPRLLPNILLGFALLGLWHGAGQTAWLWAIYSSAWLALEAVGLGERLERWPSAFRHVYLLLIVTVGWVILRADTVAGAVTFLQTMAGIRGAAGFTAVRYATVPVVIALVTAVVGAGPLVPWISRWRVTLDAATAALLMMMSAVSLFLWRGGVFVRDAVSWRRRPTPR